MNTTETEIALTVHTDTRRVTVTRYDEPPIDLFLTVRDPDGPRDQEGGSVHMTPQAAEAVAHALLGIDSHHDLDAYAARVFAKHRRDCHDGTTDDDCAACSTAVGTVSAFTLSDLADLRARWANETQPYDRGGFLVSPRYNGQDKPRAPYVEQFAPRPDRHAEIDDLRAALNDALARATRAEDRAARAEDRLARIRDAYSDLVADARHTVDTVYAVTEQQIDSVDVTVHTTATYSETTREYRTDHRTVTPGETPERLRESIDFHLQSVADLEAIARAMEDPT